MAVISVVLNRKSVMNKYLLYFARIVAKLSRCSYNGLKGFMLNHVINSGVSIHFESTCDSLIIKYTGNEFNLDDLAKSDKIFGGGSESILKLNTEGKLEYEYLNGYNVYKIPVKDNIFIETYKIEGPIDESGGKCTVYITTKLFGRQFWDNEYYNVIEEIVSNIANYVNIELKDISRTKLLWSIVNYGIHNRGSRYSSFG